MSEIPKTLTQMKFDEHFRNETFIKFWVRSIKKTNSLCSSILIMLFSLALGFLVGLFMPCGKRQLLQSMSDIFITYAVTVLGFLLVSLTLLLTNSNEREAFRRFTDDENAYHMPFIKITVMFFLFPVMIIATLLVLTILFRLMMPVFHYHKQYRNVLLIVYSVSFCIESGLFLISIRELVLNYWNIYQYMVLTVRNQSETYENEIILRYVLNNEKPGVLESEDIDIIKANLEKQK